MQPVATTTGDSACVRTTCSGGGSVAAPDSVRDSMSGMKPLAPMVIMRLIAKVPTFASDICRKMGRRHGKTTAESRGGDTKRQSMSCDTHVYRQGDTTTIIYPQMVDSKLRGQCDDDPLQIADDGMEDRGHSGM